VSSRFTFFRQPGPRLTEVSRNFDERGRHRPDRLDGLRGERPNVEPWRYVVTDDHSTPNLDLGLGVLASVERR